MHFFKKALPQKGSALLLVLSLSLAIGIISTALYQSYLNVELLMIKTNKAIELDLALDSLVQYTKKGVVSLWCFDEDKWQDDVVEKDVDGVAEITRKCGSLDGFLKHKGSVERLLMDDNFKEKLEKLVAQKNAQITEANNEDSDISNDTDIIDTEVSSCLRDSCDDGENYIEATLNIDDRNTLPNANPVKQIMEEISSYVDEIHFKIERLGVDTHNLQGRRWIRISISLLKSSKTIKELSVDYLMSPKRISSYAFLTAGELKLNEAVSSQSTEKDGSTRISSIDETQISNYGGLEVFSPVFVNKNIILPKNNHYSPVHFRAPVSIGGVMKRQKTDDSIDVFSLLNQNMSEKNMYYSEMKGVGGFSGGIELSENLDKGLDVLAGTTTKVSYKELALCLGDKPDGQTYTEQEIWGNETILDVQNIKDGFRKGLTPDEIRKRVQNHSKLMIKPISQEQISNELILKYRLRLTPPNRFKSLPFSSGGKFSGIDKISEENSNKAILSFRTLSWNSEDSSVLKQDKGFLNWNDIFSDSVIAPPDDQYSGQAYEVMDGQFYISKGNEIFAIGGVKCVSSGGSECEEQAQEGAWQSTSGLNWIRRTYGGKTFENQKNISVIKKGGTLYLLEEGIKVTQELDISTCDTGTCQMRDVFTNVINIYTGANGAIWSLVSDNSVNSYERRNEIISEKRGAHFLFKNPYMYYITPLSNIYRSTNGRNWSYIVGSYNSRYRYTEMNKHKYSAVIKDNSIYLIGGNTYLTGFTYSTNCNVVTDHSNIIKYDISKNEWTTISNTTLPGRKKPYVFAKDDYIYAMGGVSVFYNNNNRNCELKPRNDGLWRSIDGSHWEQVNTGGKIIGDEIPVAKEDGSVHFLKDGKSKFISTVSLLRVKTSPVLKEDSTDSYKNNEIDLSIKINRAPSATKQTNFTLDLLPYTLGSTDQSSSSESTYWNLHHRDFGGVSGRPSRTTLGKDDKDPSVLSALFRFKPEDFGSATDTYNMGSPDEFTFTAANIHSNKGLNYVGYAKNVSQRGNYLAKGSIDSGTLPTGFFAIRTGNDRKIYYLASQSFSNSIKKIKVIRKEDSRSWTFTFPAGDGTKYSNFGSYYKGSDLDQNFEFQEGKQYTVQVITGESDTPTGSLYHDRGVNLSSSTCEQRTSGYGDPKGKKDYIYQKDHQLEASNGKTDYSYTDWLTIGKSYFENTNSMKTCAYKSTMDDMKGLLFFCENKITKPDVFNHAWDEDFSPDTKSSWNFFCSAEQGDANQIRRFSADNEVCIQSSANTFTITPVNIHSNKDLDYVGYAKNVRGRGNYNAGGSITGTPPEDLFVIRTGKENNKFYYIASKSLSANIEKIKVTRKEDSRSWTFTFPEGDGSSYGSFGSYYKGLDNDGLWFEANKEYEIQIAKRNESSLTPRSLSALEYCSFCKPKETLCIGGGSESNCHFTLGTSLVSKKTNATTPEFHKRGLYKKCLVKSTANFVAGFFVCEEFYIESRNTPLTIIGTVVSGKIDVHKDALKKGVSWMSIYHPKAVKLLQKEGILYSSKFGLVGSNNNIGFTQDCNHLFDFKYRSDSIWSPKNHDYYKSNAYSCSPSFLVAESEGNPLSWTEVNPDCAMRGSSESKTLTCKGRKTRFFMNEISRCSNDKGGCSK